jgi:predicted dehydrogenase
MATIKAGIIGAGFIGTAHIDALRRLSHVEVVALAETERAHRKAAALGIPRAYGDYRELLADPDVQVVHNCTPNNLHFEINRAALLAGKHVLSEKPLTISSKQSAALLSQSRELPQVAAVNFNHRGYPQMRQARQLLIAGKLGRVLLAYGGYFQDWLLLETDYNWRVDAALGGPSRALADIGSHWYDLLRFVTGLRAREVFAELCTVHPQRRPPARGDQETFARPDAARSEGEAVAVATEDAASLVIRLSDGALASCVVSQVSAGRKNRLLLEIAGSSMALAWDGELPERLWVGHRAAANQLLLRDPNLLEPAAAAVSRLPGGHAEGWLDALYNVMRELYEFIAAGADPRVERPPYATFADGHEAILLVEAALRSHAEGRWVPVTGEA